MNQLYVKMKKSCKKCKNRRNVFIKNQFFRTRSIFWYIVANFQNIAQMWLFSTSLFCEPKKNRQFELSSVNTTISRIFHTKNDRNTKTIERWLLSRRLSLSEKNCQKWRYSIADKFSAIDKKWQLWTTWRDHQRLRKSFNVAYHKSQIKRLGKRWRNKLEVRNWVQKYSRKATQRII